MTCRSIRYFEAISITDANRSALLAYEWQPSARPATRAPLETVELVQADRLGNACRSQAARAPCANENHSITGQDISRSSLDFRERDQSRIGYVSRRPFVGLPYVNDVIRSSGDQRFGLFRANDLDHSSYIVDTTDVYKGAWPPIGRH